MSKTVGNPFDPPIRQLKPAITFLRELDVPAPRIAAAFGTSADHVRHLDSRTPDDPEVLLPVSISALALQFQNTLDARDAFGSKGRLGPSSPNIRRMDALEDEVQRIRAQYETANLFAGLTELKGLLPQVGKVTQPRALRARATLEENIAWFATHLGLSTTAFEHAKSAMEYCKKCYEASLGKRGHLVSFARAGLVASNSLLLSSRPLEALVTLNRVYQAKAAAGEPLGSDWFRQLATALLQHGEHDDFVRKLYLRSGEEVERESGLDSVSIRMSGYRQWNLLNPSLGWERALELASDVRFRFGAFSLQHFMAINWAAAVGLNLDSTPIEDHVQELLTSLSVCNAPFAHQRTITKLLSITPGLKLGSQVKDRWIRFALYQNVARTK